MMYGKPRKITAKKNVTRASDGTSKKRGRPRVSDATLIACTPREKRKSQWLQSPYTDVKTEYIDGPGKKRKTKAK
ncbi:hypothetical protein Bca52824_001207 [Brassica carinata]|uniref:Uncharacterized protein n=1 Tax=Brassica carinata TaxID=52824 RepID=A0A8X8BDN5_BRACI|nr:hypothetical protein Bca52824_001207 [Brassica carinata]